MPINILMPALSPTMEKGNLAKWLKKEGDKVKSGDVIAEIETDKATMEVEAVDEGTIAKILVPEGTQDVPVNDVDRGAGRRRRGCQSRPALSAAKPAPKPAATAEAAACCEACGSSGSGSSAGRQSSGIRRSDGGPSQGRCSASQRPRPHVLLAAGAASGQGSRHRFSRASTAPVRTAASSRAMSRKPSPARA